MSIPAGRFIKLYINGSWVDVTTYWDFGQLSTVTLGRSSPYSDAQVATLDGVQFNNADGRFTPKSPLLISGFTQTAADPSPGSTANPYYPYILPRMLIRTGYVASAVTYYDFWGYVQGWSPMVENGIRAYCPITAVDRGSLLAAASVRNAVLQSMLFDSPAALYPFDEPSGSTTFTDIVSGGRAFSYVPAGLISPTVSSGDGVPFPDGATATKFTGITGWSSPNAGGFSQTVGYSFPAGMATSWTISVWMGVGVGGSDPVELFFYNVGRTKNLVFSNWPTNFSGSGGVFLNYVDAATTITIIPTRLADDGLQHHFAATGSDVAGTLTIKFYIDGVLVGTGTGTGGGAFFSSPVQFGGLAQNGDPADSMTFAPLGVYAATLSAARIAQHYYGGTGGSGQLTSDRIAEYLGWFGLTSSDWAIATGSQSVTDHAVAGKSILQLCQDMAATEGGGAVFYHDMNTGKSTFLNRHYRSTITPAVTLDAEKDLRKDTYTPSFDALSLVNRSTLSRPSGSSQTYTDAASVAQYGLATDYAGSEVYPDSDSAALHIAQDRVASQSAPAFRVGRLTLAVATALTSGLAAALGTLKLGDRLRLSNLVAGKTAPGTQTDVYVEGWTKTLNFTAYDVVFDTTPADNPGRARFGSAKFAPIKGDSTLNATITAAATSMAIAWSLGPKWTTSSGSYPIIIRIDDELIQLNGVPGGSTSPQSWTGVTRGVNGTVAAPHTAGAVIHLAPTYGGFTL